MESFTPGQVIQELQRIQLEATKGAEALFRAEEKLAHAEYGYELALHGSFINTPGTVADRTAVSRLAAAEARLAADLAKAELNRIKTKLKQLELQQLSTQSIAKQVELTYKFS